MRIDRLYADDEGESHFDTIEMSMTFSDFAPPTAPILVSQQQPASSFRVAELPEGWDGHTPHPSARRQMLVCLSGSFTITASDGESRTLLAGDHLLLADTEGKGHTTKVRSTTPVTVIYVELP